MLVHDMLSRTAARFPEQVGLVHHGQRLTYREIEMMANRFAHALIHHGVQRGERVAIRLPNCVEAVVAIFGVAKAGAVFVMLNPATKQDKLCTLLNHCQATALVSDVSTLAGHIRPGHAEVPSLRLLVNRTCKSLSPPPAEVGVIDFGQIQEQFPPEAPVGEGIDLDLACLIYTSGSTGEPKGVMCDHSNVVFVTGAIVECLRNDETDVVLSVLPLTFSYGLYQLMAAVRMGARLILEESFAYPSWCCREWRKKESRDLQECRPCMHWRFRLT